MKTNLVLDLDGTLIDSRPGIEQALRAAIAEIYPGRPQLDLEFTIGPPVKEMLRSAASPATESELWALEAAFRRAYDTYCWKITAEYPGVRETLAMLEARRSRLFVFTNKPKAPAERILRRLRLLGLFTAVVSPDSRQPKYGSKTEMLLHLSRTYAFSPADATCIGDTMDDYAAAQVCQFAFVAAAYGYGDWHGHDPAIKTIAAFPELLSAI